MSVATTLAALQTLHATLSGVTSAPTDYPAALNTSTLPIVLTWPGPAEWKRAALGLNRQARDYHVKVYVGPVASGQGNNQVTQTAITLLNAFGLAYILDANVTLSGAVDHIGGDGKGNPAPVADSGITELEYAGVRYHGFEFRVPVVEKTT